MQYLFISVLLIVPFWKICQKAGFNPALSMLILVPYFGLLIVMGLLAFKAWKE
jgi:hypothetical protein